MDLATYQNEARVTATFDPKYKITYPALGLLNEAGELIEKVMEHYTGSVSYTKDELMSECGDVLWYTSAVCDFCGINLDDIYNPDMYLSFDYGDYFVVCAKIAGVAKKSVRDNDGVVNVIKMFPLLQRFMCMTDTLAGELGFTIHDAAEKNIAKLRDRQSRNVIKGEGDHR